MRKRDQINTTIDHEIWLLAKKLGIKWTEALELGIKILSNVDYEYKELVELKEEGKVLERKLFVNRLNIQEFEKKMKKDEGRVLNEYGLSLISEAKENDVINKPHVINVWYNTLKIHTGYAGSVEDYKKLIS